MVERDISGVGRVEVRADDENEDPHKSMRLFRLMEAPTFRPTKDEFKDPHEYIRSLSAAGEQYGIVKIIPPKSWQPKFALDAGAFKFSTRKQTIKSMGATTRSTMDWLDRLTRFHLMHGRQIVRTPQLHDPEDPTAPPVGINLYSIKRLIDIRNAGQAPAAAPEDPLVFWKSVCRRIHVPPQFAATISQLYHELILPHEQYCAFAKQTPLFSIPQDVDLKRKRHSGNGPEDDPVEWSRGSKKVSLISPPPEEELKTEDDDRRRSPRTRSRRTRANHTEPESPRQGTRRSHRNSSDVSYAEKSDGEKSDDSDVEYDDSEDADCPYCKQIVNDQDRYFSCTECGEFYHQQCLSLSLSIVDYEGVGPTWYCPKCLVDTAQFYFDEGGEYTLATFKQMADEFKHEYLNQRMPEYETATRDQIEVFLEEEFWRHVEDIGSDLSVEYGADLKCDEKGSGFPLVAKDPYHKYARDQWNLNNFPQLKRSLFHYMKQDISGVTLPWAYVGMLFSAFCWHSEDHYTYSVNYQHFGDTKTWYGVPGSMADRFEETCRTIAPEIFANQPEALFQRSTVVPPRRLVEHGVPVYVVDQRAGQFVVTFPKAYHSGLNQGFNFNEAVNYAPPDWVRFGRQSVEDYAIQKRVPLFSVDQLLLSVAEKDLRPDTAEWLLEELREVIWQEQEHRLTTKKAYPTVTEVLDKKDADESKLQCNECNSIAFFSRVVAKDWDGKVMGTFCHHHANLAKKQGKKIVVYVKSSLDSLHQLYKDVASRLEVKPETA